MLTTWSNPPVAHIETYGSLTASLSDAAATDDLQWRRVERDILAMHYLEDGWDGEFAETPHRAVVDSAIYVLGLSRKQRLPAPSRAVVSPSGTVVIEWQRCGQGYLEAEIGEPYCVEWMHKRADEAATHWSDRWSAPTAEPKDCQTESDIWDGYLVPAY